MATRFGAVGYSETEAEAVHLETAAVGSGMPPEEMLEDLVLAEPPVDSLAMEMAEVGLVAGSVAEEDWM